MKYSSVLVLWCSLSPQGLLQRRWPGHFKYACQTREAFSPGRDPPAKVEINFAACAGVFNN